MIHGLPAEGKAGSSRVSRRHEPVLTELVSLNRPRQSQESLVGGLATGGLGLQGRLSLEGGHNLNQQGGGEVTSGGEGRVVARVMARAVRHRHLHIYAYLSIYLYLHIHM